MFILKKDNVERIVSDECNRDILIGEGYETLELKKELSKMTTEQLKSMASGKGLEFDAKAKKADLIILLESVEGGE